LTGEKLTVQEIKRESEYYQFVSDTDIDMIPKNCVEVIIREK
jgi:hypothetical protein